MSRAVVLSAVRTPVGRYGGALAEERPDGVRHGLAVAVPEVAAGGEVAARVDGRDRRERGRALRGVSRGAGRVRAPLAPAVGGGRRGGAVRRRAGGGRRGGARRTPAARHELGEAGRAA